MSISNSTPTPKCALIIGHPGHELRVLGWLRATKALVVVLTDGSGHGGNPRLALTKRLIEITDAEASPLYGVTSDLEIYRAILEQDMPFFIALAGRLAELLVQREIEVVAGDAIEGYNPAHDVCRLVIDKAVDIAQRKTGRSIRNCTFPLVGAPEPATMPAGVWRLTLDASQLAEKLAESRRYAKAAGRLLETEVEGMLQVFGEAAFAQEVLYPMDTAAVLARFEKERPFYELHGAEQVAAGHYQHIIRFRKHVAPIAATLAAQE